MMARFLGILFGLVMLFSSPLFAKGSWLKIAGGQDVFLLQDTKAEDLRSIVYVIHGDGTLRGIVPNYCSRARREISDPTVLLACIFRQQNFNPTVMRSTKELKRLEATIRHLDQKHPLPRHCVGHSGGGHNCVAVTQISNIEFGCLVAASAPLATKAWAEARNKKLGGSGGVTALKKAQWDASDHVHKTRAEKLILIGDKEDDFVEPIAWEAFMANARNAGIPHQFIEVRGRKHDTVRDGFKAMDNCL